MASEDEFDCGTCRGEPAPPGTKTVREWDGKYTYTTRYVYRPTIWDRLADLVFCTECFRLRISPGHWLTKAWHSAGEQHDERN